MDSGVQYRENATYIESVMNEFTEKTDALKNAMDEIAGSISTITDAISEGAKGVNGAAESTQLLVVIWRRSAAVWIRMRPLPRHYRKKQIFLQTFNLGDKGNSAFAGIPFFACLIL